MHTIIACIMHHCLVRYLLSHILSTHCINMNILYTLFARALRLYMGHGMHREAHRRTFSSHELLHAVSIHYPMFTRMPVI